MPAPLPTNLLETQPANPAAYYLKGAEFGLEQQTAQARLAEFAQRTQLEQQQIEMQKDEYQKKHLEAMHQMEVQKAYYDQSMSLRKQEIAGEQQRIMQAAQLANQRWNQQKEFQMMVERLRLQGQESLADRQIKYQEEATKRAEKAQRDRTLDEIIRGAQTSYNNLLKDYNVKKDPDIKAQMDEKERIINNAMKQVDPSLQSLYTGGVTDVILENGRLVFKDPSKRKPMAPQVGEGGQSMVPTKASLPLVMQGLNILNPAGWAVPDIESLSKKPAWSPDHEEDAFDVTGWRNPQ